MGKRSDYAPRENPNLWLTPAEAVLPLKPFLRRGSTFYEPCAADGGLAAALAQLLGLWCSGMSDISPLNQKVKRIDALTISAGVSDAFITNPPWERLLLHRLIDHLKWVRPTWMLIDSDWLFTKQAAEYIPDATHIVAIGRIKWIPDSDSVGMDNACWVRFVGGHDSGPKFYPNW